MPKPSKFGYTQSDPNLLVDFGNGDFDSCLRATKALKAGEYVAPLALGRLTLGPKAYTSVQCGLGRNDHVELNSDLVYSAAIFNPHQVSQQLTSGFFVPPVNHSCDPNVAFDLSSSDPSEWHVRALRRIEPGAPVTFFYPSTEWDMDQPFTCECQVKTCLGSIRGAKYLTLSQLAEQRWISPYILKLVAERDNSL